MKLYKSQYLLLAATFIANLNVVQAETKSLSAPQLQQEQEAVLDDTALQTSAIPEGPGGYVYLLSTPEPGPYSYSCDEGQTFIGVPLTDVHEDGESFSFHIKASATAKKCTVFGPENQQITQVSSDDESAEDTAAEVEESAGGEVVDEQPVKTECACMVKEKPYNSNIYCLPNSSCVPHPDVLKHPDRIIKKIGIPQCVWKDSKCQLEEIKVSEDLTERVISQCIQVGRSGDPWESAPDKMKRCNNSKVSVQLNKYNDNNPPVKEEECNAVNELNSGDRNDHTCLKVNTHIPTFLDKKVSFGTEPRSKHQHQYRCNWLNGTGGSPGRVVSGCSTLTSPECTPAKKCKTAWTKGYVGEAYPPINRKPWDPKDLIREEDKVPGTSCYRAFDPKLRVNIVVCPYGNYFCAAEEQNFVTGVCRKQNIK